MWDSMPPSAVADAADSSTPGSTAPLLAAVAVEPTFLRGISRLLEAIFLRK